MGENVTGRTYDASPLCVPFGCSEIEEGDGSAFTSLF